VHGMYTNMHTHIRVTLCTYVYVYECIRTCVYMYIYYGKGQKFPSLDKFLKICLVL